MKFTLVDEELPKTRLSKLKRFQLPEMMEARSQKKEITEQPDWKEYEIIKDYIESIKPGPIHPDDHLEIEIALDALDKVSLLVFIKNTFGIEIDERRLIQLQTPKKLSEFLRDNQRGIQRIAKRKIFPTTVYQNIRNF